MARSRVTSQSPAGRERNDQVVEITGQTQPSFIRNLLGRFGRDRNGTIVTVGRSVTEGNRYGDIRAEDIFPGSIRTIHIDDLSVTTAKINDLSVTTAKIANLAVTNAKINDLSADKITAGTIDAGSVTISSDDGKMYLSGNIFAVDNGADVRQITVGKYDGTNYGLAIGSNASDPFVWMNKDGIFCDGNSASPGPALVGFSLTGGSKIYFDDEDYDNDATIGFVTDYFVILGDTTTGLNLNGNGGNISLGESSGNYGGGNKVIYIPNAGSAPSSNPTGGGILYAESGALKWRGSAGTTTTIAAA